MEVYTWLAFSGFLGVCLGLNPNFRNSLSNFFYDKSNLDERNITKSNRLKSKPTIDFASCHFDDKELFFLSQLIHSNENGKGVSIDFLNEIIDPNKLNTLNSRLMRHSFLSDLNLKLFLIYGIRESIVRKGTVEDRRRKSYFLDQSISIVHLEKDFDVKFKQLVYKQLLTN